MLVRVINHLTLIAGLGLAVYSTAWGQSTEEPGLTEVWEPEPVKVSPGDGGSPPSDATILFDGKSLDAWRYKDGTAARWDLQDGVMTVPKRINNQDRSIWTRQTFGDVQLHLEWRAPATDTDEGQNRGNSGVFLQGLYEVQVLDSYANRTYSNGQAGSIYKQHIPLVNASRPGGEWQTYDIVFQAPRFSAGGELLSPASITVFHNGVLAQNHVQLKGPTVYIGEPVYVAHPVKLPLMLQDHTDQVSYRNIWIRELNGSP